MQYKNLNTTLFIVVHEIVDQKSLQTKIFGQIILWE